MISRQPLRAADLVPGKTYYSPSGRLCKMLRLGQSGLGVNALSFAYVSRRTGNALSDDGFMLDAGNSVAIAAMREADIARPVIHANTWWQGTE